MYKLTLTAEERQAFDWVGDRYNAGRVADILLDYLPEGVEWTDAGEITFDVEETDAWKIQQLADEEEFAWPCFSIELAAKLNAFCDSII